MEYQNSPHISSPLFHADLTIIGPHTGREVIGRCVEELAENLLASVRVWVQHRDRHVNRKPRLRNPRFDVWETFGQWELNDEVRGMLFEVEALLSDSAAKKSRVRANLPPRPTKLTARPPRSDGSGNFLLGY